MIETSIRLRESPEFELYDLIAREPGMFERVVERQMAGLAKEVDELGGEAERLGKEIGELTGRVAAGGNG